MKSFFRSTAVEFYSWNITTDVLYRMEIWFLTEPELPQVVVLAHYVIEATTPKEPLMVKGDVLILTKILGDHSVTFLWKSREKRS